MEEKTLLSFIGQEGIKRVLKTSIYKYWLSRKSKNAKNTLK